MSENWEAISHDPYTGLTKYIGSNPDDPDGVLVKYEQSAQSIEQILDRNKASQADGFDRKDDMWHAASIPIGVMFEWKQKYNVDAWAVATDPDQAKAVRRLLNSDEYRYLRVNHFIM